MIVEMIKVRVLGPKGLLPEATDLLHTLGVVHIESLPVEFEKKERYLKKMTLDDEGAKKRALFEKIRDDVKHILLMLPSIRSAASEKEEKRPAEISWFLSSDSFLRDIITLIKEIGQKADTVTSKKKIYQDELDLLKKYGDILNALSPFILKIKESREFDYIGITVRGKEDKMIPYIRDAIERLVENKFEIFGAPVDEDTIACLLVLNKADVGRIKKLLWEENISELRLPEAAADKPLPEALRFLIKRRIELDRDIESVNNELKALGSEWHHRLNTYSAGLEDAISQIATTAYFYETKFTFAIYGWIPKTSIDSIKKSITEKFGNKVLLEELEIQEKEMEFVPVFLKNPRLIKPFELFMRILPLPKYGSIDPTPFIAIFFPIFFGAIVGDIAYGIIILLTAFFIKYKYKNRQFLSDISHIYIISSLYTIFFGFLYGEFLGELGTQIGLEPLCVDRMHAIIPMLLFSVSVGVGHIFLGLILGIITSLRLGHRREVIAKLSKLLIIVIVLLLLGVYTKVIPQVIYTPSVIAILIAFPVLVISGGLLAPLELFKAFGNILSYVRLMAFGLASIFLAYVANALGGITGNIILGVFIAATFHFFNILISLLSPTIQSIRLQYVEFFGKFFIPGGRKYSPFKKTH